MSLVDSQPLASTPAEVPPLQWHRELDECIRACREQLERRRDAAGRQ